MSYAEIARRDAEAASFPMSIDERVADLKSRLRSLSLIGHRDLGPDSAHDRATEIERLAASCAGLLCALTEELGDNLPGGDGAASSAYLGGLLRDAFGGGLILPVDALAAFGDDGENRVCWRAHQLIDA